MLNIIIASLISSILAMGLGVFWYGKAGFGKRWMKLAGISESDMKNPKNGMTPTVGMGLGFFTTVLKAFILGLLITWLVPITLFEALAYGALLWLGFQATIDIGVVLWSMKSWKLFYLNTSYNLLVILIMATVAFYII